MRIGAPVVVLLLAAAGSLHARQALPPPLPAASAASATSQQPAAPPLTPRQAAEMRGDILMARKDYAAAAGAYEKVLRHDPHNAALLNKIGMAYQELGDGWHAARFYKRASKADRHFSAPVNNLGTLEYSHGRYGKAVKYYKKALAVSRDRATVYSNLGYAYCGSRQYARATNAFRKAVALDPNIFDRRGEFGPVFQQRSAPDPAELYFLMAKSYALAGDAAHAAHYLKIARDDGYKQFRSARTDPAFARVIKDPQVQEVLLVRPPYADGGAAAPPK